MLTRLGALAASCLLLCWLERRAALVPAAGGPRRLLVNLLLAALAIPTSALVTLLGAQGWAGALDVPRLLAQATGPGWLGAALGVAALDFVAWAGHLALHHTRLGWHVHRVHHSDTTVDVTTALRQHPLETLWRVALPVPVVALLGLSPGVVAAYYALSALFAQLEHANLRWQGRLERVLALVLVTPNQHKWHHSRDARETDTNYGNVFSVWDRIFGTRTAGGDLARLRYGLDGLDERAVQSLPALLSLRLAP